MRTSTKIVPIYSLKKFVYRCLLIFLISIVFLNLFTFYFTNITKSNPIKYQTQCYRNSTQETLPDISESEPPPLGKSIFFHETSCNSHIANKIVITARQACAVESAARLNPEYQTHLLYASPGVFKLEERTESDRFLSALLEYKNIRILHLNLVKFINNTPLADLYKENSAIETSMFLEWHLSDILRFLTLWKYGGIYLDLDVIVVKPLDDLGVNYAGVESDRVVSAGILNFEPDNFGHKIVGECLDELKNKFQIYEWGNNAPGIITKMMQKVCHEELPARMVNRRCEGGFTVHPLKRFYPIEWWNWTVYFNEILTEKVVDLARESYFIYVWNKISADQKLKKESKAAYLVYARKYCPKVYEEVVEYF